MRAVIFDTEVNSLEAMEVIELAYCWCDIVDGKYTFGEIITERFKPIKPIEAGAMAVHGITDEDLMYCRQSLEASIPDAEIIIGHNVDFDAEVMKNESAKRICTLALSRHFFPTFKQHTLGAMFLELFGKNKRNVELLRNSHSADNDVKILSEIVTVITNGRGVQSLGDLYALSEIARVPTVMAFGKHKGEAIENVPRSYMQWYLSQADVDPYLRKAFIAQL